MTTIETLFIILAAIISLPTLCRLISRPAMLYCSYLILGVILGGFIELKTSLMLNEVGTIGFLLLLFLIGLEIEVPRFSVLKKTLPFCLYWMCIQMPIFVMASWLTGFGWGFGFVAGAGINACSLGIAYGILKSQEKQMDLDARNHILIQMALLEIIALFILVGSDVVYAHGWGEEVAWQAGILFSFLIAMRIFSGVIHKHLGRLIESSGKWRIHQIFLIILSVTMIGQRLGLSAPKTAFFLGLFMSSVTNNGVKFEDELKPIAQRILIPLFFISLGTRISPEALFPYVLPISVLIALVLVSIRFVIFRYSNSKRLPEKYSLLFSPNITMVAVAVEILSHSSVPKEQIDVLLVTGLLMTLGVGLLFPTPAEAYQKFEEIPLKEG